ncbi:galactosylceramide sulfotransferase-like [Glandiceps talaboti]
MDGIQRRPLSSQTKDFIRSKLIAMTDSSCIKHKNIAFVKPHKTGGTTLASIINRFGYDRRLSFVICRFNRRNGHLRQLPITSDSPRTIFLPPIQGKGAKYNMIAVHAIYNKTAMHSFMEPSADYITILREPVAQFESFFHFMQLKTAVVRAGKPANISALEAFLQNPDFYVPKLFFDRDKDSRNNQFYYLGLQPKFFENERIINETIQIIDNDFSLVLITDYFDESLLLLKKMFCWDIEDILYVKKNQRAHRSEVPDDLATKIRQWNRADVLLYDYFNRTLWRKIKEYGPNFDSDLAEFRRHLQDTFEECIDSNEFEIQKRMRKRLEYKAKSHSTKFCSSLSRTHLDMHKMIWNRQYPRQKV